MDLPFIPSFTGHETFPFRYPWPAKGVRGITSDAELFSRDDALVTLGVGKNMVKSIRHWCEAMSLIQKPLLKESQIIPTPLGELIFGMEGCDPFLEDPGTLWLLHWLLVSRGERASAWYLLFTQYTGETFSRERLVHWLEDIARRHPAARATTASIKRDVDVLLRTYVAARAKRSMPAEETFDSPLVELGLIIPLDEGLYTFARGPKGSLPDSIFQFALLEYWEKVAKERGSLSFDSVLYGPGSPGAAFKLSENALAERLERIPTNLNIRFDETAGLRNLLGEPKTSSNEALQVLEQYYRAGNR